MLILERGLGEWVRIGKDINILVHRVEGKHVWLGFDAPRSIPITRDDCAVDGLGSKILLGLGETMAVKLAELLRDAGYSMPSTPDDLFTSLVGFIGKHTTKGDCNELRVRSEHAAGVGQ